LRQISAILKDMGQEPMRLLTDVTGEPFWTIVAEAKVEKVDDFFAMEQTLMANQALQKTMADFRWLDLPLPTTKHGFPIQDRGIVESVPGLYFMGLLFQYSLSSALLGGVGRDAEYIVDHIGRQRVMRGVHRRRRTV